MKRPKVSIIIPAYNCGEFICDCIRSVTSQTENMLEVIVVNDGSTDNTHSVLKQLAQEDSRIVVFNQNNSGRPSIVRNVGIRAAKGEYICFLDGDDLYHPEKIRRCVEVLEHNPDIDMVFHDVKCIAKDGSPHDGTYLGNAEFHRLAAPYLLHDHDDVYLCNSRFYNFMSAYISSIHTSSIFIRRMVMDEENEWFPEESLIGEDIDLWFRLAKKHRIAFIDDSLSFYRQHEASLTKQSVVMLQGSIEVHRKNFQRAEALLTSVERTVYAKRISQLHYHLGYHYFQQFHYDDARTMLLLSLRWSFSTKAFTVLLKTYLPKTLAENYRK